MKHLTTTQFLQFIDGSLDYASQAQCTSHLAICEKCRKEVELQKFIAKESHRQPIVRTSPRFAQSVMTRILPHPEKSWRGAFRTLGKAGVRLAQCSGLIAVKSLTRGN